MLTATFADELRRFGPGQDAAEQPSPAAARRYCRRLARCHYENFTVASWFLPRRLEQHFYNVYAYCRWADDLADETGSTAKSLELLDWWEDELRECYDGRARHPVFVALAETIERFSIPVDPFADLLTAFRQDQRVTRYETFDELLNYCRCSANPVGRLVLYLGECHNERCAELSDSVCTGLQLANFWQDVARDFGISRVYLPADDRRRFGYDESMLARRESNDAFRALLADEVDRADRLLLDGLPLVGLVPRSLALDVALFIQGGRAILEAIRRQDYDVWSRRPTLSKLDKIKIAAGTWWRFQRGTLVGDSR